VATVVTPVPWKVLTKVYNEIQTEDLFLQKTLVPPSNVQKLLTEFVTYRIVRQPMSVASLGLPGDPPKQVNISVKVEEVTHRVLQIFEEDQVNVGQLAYDWRLDILNQGVLDSANDIAASLAALYTPKLTELKNRLKRRLELMFAQVLSTGKISYNDGVRNIEIDYGIPAAGNISFASNAHVLSDLKEAVDDFTRNFGMMPNIIIFSPDIVDAFLNNQQVEKFINRNTFGWGNIKPARVSGTTFYLGSFPEFGIPDIYVYQGYYIDPTTGNKMPYLPDSRVIMTHTSIWNLAYGAIFDFELEPSGRPIVTDVLVKESVVNRGTAKVITVLSKPLVYITNSYGIKVLEVTV